MALADTRGADVRFAPEAGVACYDRDKIQRRAIKSIGTQLSLTLGEASPDDFLALAPQVRVQDMGEPPCIAPL
jgi:hypothetical protein